MTTRRCNARITQSKTKQIEALDAKLNFYTFTLFLRATL
jgi:hypothetical protein